MKATIQKLCMLSAALSTCAVNAAVYELAHDEVLKIDDGNVAAYADGIKFTGANAVVEFATSSAPRMDWIGGENGGVVRKTNDAEWTMDVKRDRFNGDVEIRAGVVVAAVEQCLGTSWTYDKKVTVFEGATLSMKRVEGLFRAARKLHIRGDGVNGRGTVEFSEKAFALVDQIGYLVLDADATIVNREPSAGYLYMNALTLNGHRLYFTFRRNQTVAIEVKVMDFFTEISAEGIEFIAVCIILNQSLIDPVPDETSLKFRIIHEKIPVIGQRTATVAHCMAVFYKDQRTV